MGFNFSVTTNFILEFGNEYLRLWSNGIAVRKSLISVAEWVTATTYLKGDYVKSSDIIYFATQGHVAAATFAADLAAGKWVAQDILEVPMPYLEADLRTIQYCQINDLLYLTHPNYPPAKLTRHADDDWRYEEIQWKFPPTLDENVTPLTIAPSAATGNITLTASAALFTEEHVGSYWTITHRRSGLNHSYVEVALAASSIATGPLNVIGSWELTTYGSWSGTLQVQRFVEGGANWEVIRTYASSVVGHRNVSTTGNEEKSCQLRLVFNTLGAAGSSNPLARLEVGDSRYTGFVQVSAYTSPTVVSATVRLSLWTTSATEFWAEGAFSRRQGYARVVALHESRLIFAGTKLKPLRLHGSALDDFENHRKGSLANEAIDFTLSANESNPINWMLSQGDLLIGTAGEEWTLERTDDAEALSATNVNAERQSSYGSAYLQARLVNEVVMFVQRQGRKVRELTFAFEKDGWVAPDLTILANHITGKGIVETAFQQQPDAVYWIITSDGKLRGMTYERDQNVVGWHPHITDGVVESLATIYGGQGADEAWFAIRRTINGSDARYIERIHPTHRDEFEDMASDKWWYVDCGIRRVTAANESIVSGLSHLEGKTLAIFADGAAQPDRTVTGGSITLAYPAKNVLAGLRYTSTLKPMKVEIKLPDGSVKSRRARVHNIAIKVYKSLGLEFSTDIESELLWEEVPFRQPGQLMNAGTPAFTGTARVAMGGGYADDCEYLVRHDKPTPLCILSLIPKVDFIGRMKASLLQLRPFEPDRDYQDFYDWYEAHGTVAPVRALLPPIGAVIYRDFGDRQEKVGMIFLYLAQGVPVSFMEHLVARPGLTTRQVRDIAVHFLNYFKMLGPKMGYGLIVAHTVRSISRLMQHEGWSKIAGELDSLVITTTA